MADQPIIMFDGEELHAALCRALLKREPEYGTKGPVAEALGIRSQHYSRVIARTVMPHEPVIRWCMQARVRLAIYEQRASFDVPWYTAEQAA